jgi:hypothetical protein
MATMVQPCIKVARPMIPCVTTWLPKSTIHLAVELEAKSKGRRIWFPVDDVEEPHPKNPDDGYGGALYPLKTVHIYETSLKHTRICENKKETQALFREAAEQLNRGSYTREYIWYQFIKGCDKLPQPEYSYCGLLWRNLYGTNPRDEEVDEEDLDWDKLKNELCVIKRLL